MPSPPSPSPSADRSSAPSPTTPPSHRLSLVATCALGLEEFLEGELREIGVGGVERLRSAVAFTGSWEDVWRTNWRLRTANRVLVELASWDAGGEDELERGARELVEGRHDWAGVRAEELFHPGRTFAVHATSSRSALTDRRWVALKVKDGLVDAQRERYGRRASVDRDEPDLQLRLRLHEDRATLLLDTSGDSLDHRGYRLDTAAAPVREQLAAACVLAAGWDGSGPVVDPMCGSATLLAEAGFWALGWAPGRLRPSWGFETLPGFDREAWERVRSEPIPAPNPEVSLLGVDRAREAIAAAKANLERAGLVEHASLWIGEASAFEPPEEPGLVIVNPPHGERLEEERELWPKLGDLLKQRYTGWRAVVLAGGETLGKHIGLKPERRIPVRNGPLDARILLFDLY